jgi:hypothetical protein
MQASIVVKAADSSAPPVAVAAAPPVPVQVVVRHRPPADGSTGPPLLDRVAEARRFRMLHALGHDAICTPFPRNVGRIGCCADARIADGIPAVQPGRADPAAPQPLTVPSPGPAVSAAARSGFGVDFLAGAFDHEGRNALMLAIVSQHTPLVRLLLEHPATAGQVIDVADCGNDALLFAVGTGNQAIVSLLLADPMATILLDGVDRTGASALMLAARCGHVAILAMLLGAMSAQQVNERDADGSNALMLAAQHGHAEAVSMLLADPRTTQQVFHLDKKGMNALTRATLAGSRASVDALVGDVSALGQVAAISQETFNSLVTKVVDQGGRKFFTPGGTSNASRSPGARRYKVSEVASYCSPRAMLTLLPIIARMVAESRGE